MKKVTINYFINAIEKYNEGRSDYDYLVSLAGYYATNHKRPVLFECDQESGKVTRLFMVDSLNPITEYKTVWRIDGLEETKTAKPTIQECIDVATLYNNSECTAREVVHIIDCYDRTHNSEICYKLADGSTDRIAMNVEPESEIVELYLETSHRKTTVWTRDDLKNETVTIEKVVESVIAYNNGEVEITTLIDLQHEWNNTHKTVLNYVFETSYETTLNDEVVAIYISRKLDNRKIRDVWKRAEFSGA